MRRQSTKHFMVETVLVFFVCLSVHPSVHPSSLSPFNAKILFFFVFLSLPLCGEVVLMNVHTVTCTRLLPGTMVKSLTDPLSFLPPSLSPSISPSPCVLVSQLRYPFLPVFPRQVEEVFFPPPTALLPSPNIEWRETPSARCSEKKNPRGPSAPLAREKRERKGVSLISSPREVSSSSSSMAAAAFFLSFFFSVSLFCLFRTKSSWALLLPSLPPSSAFFVPWAVVGAFGRPAARSPQAAAQRRLT